MSLSSTNRIAQSLLNEAAEIPGLEIPTLAIPFLSLPPQFHRKSNGIYVYKTGTEDEVCIRMAKPPRDEKDFFDLAMALAQRTTFHGQYVFVEHVISKGDLSFSEEEQNFLNIIDGKLQEVEEQFSKVLASAKKQYMDRLKDLRDKYSKITDKEEALKLLEEGNKLALEEEKMKVEKAIQIKDKSILHFYKARTHILEHSEANRKKYSIELFREKFSNLLYKRSSERFNEVFANIGNDQHEIEMKSKNFIKTLNEKTKRLVKNLLIDAALAGHKTAYEHLELLDLNFGNDINLTIVKKLITIKEFQKLVWDLRKFGGTSSYYWLEKPEETEALIVHLTNLIDEMKAEKERIEIEKSIKATAAKMRNCDLSKTSIDEQEDEVDEEMISISSSSRNKISRSATVDEMARASASPNGQEETNRPRSVF